jgi:hypothetical protein
MKYWIFALNSACHGDPQMEMCSENSIGFFGFLCSVCPVRNESASALAASPSVPEKTRSNSTFASFENTTIWFLGTINCIFVALVFSKGKPFRQPTYTNCE